MIRLAKQPGEACKKCGHWGSSPEFGFDDRTGYCDALEKLTAADYWCDLYIAKEKYQRQQEEIYEQMEAEGGEFEE